MEKFKAAQYAILYADNEAVDKEYIDAYSTDDLMTQLTEELGELTSAISKYKRAKGISGPMTPVTEETAYDNLLEEMSDTMFLILAIGEKENIIEKLIELHKEKGKKVQKRLG